MSLYKSCRSSYSDASVIVLLSEWLALALLGFNTFWKLINVTQFLKKGTKEDFEETAGLKMDRHL
jgi:hypothetical protein